MKKLLKKIGLDAAIFYNLDIDKLSKNYFYCTGTEALGIVIVPAKGRKIHLVPDMEKGRVKSRTCRLNLENLKKYTEKHKKIGADLNNLSVTSYNKLKKLSKAKIMNISDEMQKIRSVKKEDEIKSIKKACKITDDIIYNIVKNFKKFRTEDDVRAFMINEIIRSGCNPAFEPTIASGSNASVPHHEASGTLKKGFIVMDFGVRYKGYCSDMTRTLYIGKPTKKEIELYYNILKIQEDCIRLSGEKSPKQLDKFARDQLGVHLNHALGHGLGIAVHESPYIGPKSKDKLKPGMVFTIEPGYYVPGKIGIRIEDDILMTKKGQVVLTKFPKNLVLL